MLRDNMSLQKKEMQTARADIGDAVAVTANIDGRFHMLQSEMRSLWKKITDEQVARDKAAADKPIPIMPVSIPPGHSCTVTDSQYTSAPQQWILWLCSQRVCCAMVSFVQLLMAQAGSNRSFIRCSTLFCHVCLAEQ